MKNITTIPSKKTFMLQTEYDETLKTNIPQSDIVYSTMDAIKFYNWYYQDPNSKAQTYNYIYCDNSFASVIGNVNLLPCDYLAFIPIGSLEFCLKWYSDILKINPIPKPLNVPRELWELDNKINKITNAVDGHYFMKDMNNHKSSIGQEIKKGCIERENRFFSEWIYNIVSEYRLFIYRKKIIDMKNYNGDPFVVPDKNFVNKIVDKYNKKSYTLDIMVDDKGINYIVEVHNFFACGLYGFSNYEHIIKMSIATHNELIKMI